MNSKEIDSRVCDIGSDLFPKCFLTKGGGVEMLIEKFIKGNRNDDVELFSLSGYASSITPSGYEKEYYLGISDGLGSILDEYYADEKGPLLSHICESLSAYAGGKVKVMPGDLDPSTHSLMYRVKSYASDFSEDGSTMQTYGTLEQTSAIDDLNEECEEMPVYWSMGLELPEERLSAIIETMGLAIELVGHGDDSLITMLSRRYG